MELPAQLAIRILIKFSNPGSVSDDWIKIHIANCAGKDKLSYSDRIQWVNVNEDALISVGNDPKENLKWLLDQEIDGEKKTKWQFLAACIEYVQYKKTGEWSIPVGVDATSSGLQFLSAVARDESIAEDVNISTCTYAPVGDLYQKLGNAVVEACLLYTSPSPRD